MTVLSADKSRRQRNVHMKRLRRVLMKTGDTYYQGHLISILSADGDGQAATDATGTIFAGVYAGDQVTLTADTWKQVEWGHEEWFPSSGIAATDLLDIAHIVDDATVGDAAAAPTGTVKCGTITEFETINGVAGAWIEVGMGYALAAS